MDTIEMVPLKPCPFCGADATAKWVMDETAMENGHGGKAIRISCSREGMCPSPTWCEPCDEHENDAECMMSVSSFWNQRAEDWEPAELLRLKVDLALSEKELRLVRIERDRAMKACEQISSARQEIP